MLDQLSYSFIDGGFLQSRTEELGLPHVNPSLLIHTLVNSKHHRFKYPSWGPASIRNARTIYYDGRPDERDAHPRRKEYWRAISRIDDTELGFGSVVRGGKKLDQPRQKGVDTLIAVDMLSGAYKRLFPVAILIGGDADLYPIVDAVRSEGVMVILGGIEEHMSDELRRACDRFVDIRDSLQKCPLKDTYREWIRS